MAEVARQQDWPRTVEEFEAWRAREPERWEFVDGEPRMMAPASMNHTIIKGNAYRALGNELADRGCTALVDGAQILTDEISAIPDVVVTCSPIDHSTPVIAAPVIIVEVSSPSSRGDISGLKWLAYRRIPSLQHYLVVAQDQWLVHVHSRAGEIWRERFVSEGMVALDEPAVQLDLAVLYAATDLAA